jgi:hypothetical protein
MHDSNNTCSDFLSNNVTTLLQQLRLGVQYRKMGSTSLASIYCFAILLQHIPTCARENKRQFCHVCNELHNVLPYRYVIDICLPFNITQQGRECEWKKVRVFHCWLVLVLH